MKKLFSLALLACWLLSGGIAFASFGVQEDGSEEGQTANLNASTNLDISNDGVTATLVVSPAPSFAGNVTLGDATTDSHTANGDLIVTHYIRVPYYSITTRPASGAPQGTLILKGGAANDCGAAVHGTTQTVCVSNGTNWIPV